MRTKNSIRNSTIAMLSLIITLMISFVAQKIFLDNLGIEYLGIHGLFTNIISALSIIELGIGPAIIYSLYKPIASKDTNKIVALLQFYKKCYRIMAIVVIGISLLILPFLSSIVGEINISDSIYLIFGLFVLDTSLSYLLTYRKSILLADQKNYILDLFNLGYTIVVNIIQIIILIYTKNFILYLIIEILLRSIENIIINILINKQYPYINTSKQKLDKETLLDIKQKVKGLFFHKIGGFVVFGTDNILISTFIGIAYVGLYSNYLLITNSIASILYKVFTSTIGSVGNLIVTESKEKVFKTYKLINNINFYIALTLTVSFTTCIQPFITIWLKNEFLLEYYIVIAICINFYLNIMRNSISLFKDAAGVFYEDRFIPLIESFVNLSVSIICLYFFGFIGVLIGTISSNLVLYLYSYPTFIYKKVFKKKKSEYILNFFKELTILTITILIAVFITSYININNLILETIIKLLITIIITTLIFILTTKKDLNYKEFKKILNKAKNA